MYIIVHKRYFCFILLEYSNIKFTVIINYVMIKITLKYEKYEVINE